MAVVVKTSFDWADEFDCREVKVFDDEEYAKWIAAWERVFAEGGDVEINFGSNEALTIESFDDFQSGLEVIEISEADRKVFDKVFEGESWGTGGVFDFDGFDDEYWNDEDDETDLPEFDANDVDE